MRILDLEVSPCVLALLERCDGRKARAVLRHLAEAGVISLSP